MEFQLLMAAAAHITAAEQQISLALQQVLIAAAGQQLLLPLQLPLLPLHELLQLLLQPLPLLLALGLPQAVAVVTRQGQVESQGRLGWTAARLSPAAIAAAAAVELQPMAIQLAEPLLPTLKQLLPLRSGEIGGRDVAIELGALQQLIAQRWADAAVAAHQRPSDRFGQQRQPLAPALQAFLRLGFCPLQRRRG